MQRRALAGGFLLSMMAVRMAWSLSPATAQQPVPVVIGWLGVGAALLLLPDIRRSQHLQAGVLLAIGLGLLVFASTRQAQPDWSEALTRNTGLLSMILAVGFLKLVVGGSLHEVERLPSGRRPYLQTLAGTALFGAVINISALIIIGDRLTRRREMDLFTAASLTRIFSACAAWSPFFAGMGVVLTHVANVRLPVLMAGGLPLALISLGYVYALSVNRNADRVAAFHGYPIQWASLWVPLCLSLMVILAHEHLPDVSIVILIAVSALLLTSVYLVCSSGLTGAAQALNLYVRTELSRSGNELVLFLVAGVLASGLHSLVELGLLASPFTHFDASVASLVLAIMVVIAALGVHPIIQISAFTPLLLVTGPMPELLALTYLFAWSLGTCASPLSGTHLMIQGRYGVPAWRGAVQNWPYVAVMYVVAVGLLHGLEVWLP